MRRIVGLSVDTIRVHISLHIRMRCPEWRNIWLCRWRQ